jgi:bacterioferritin
MDQPLEEEDMKGNKQIIEQLNMRLAEELTAINQYMVHAEMDENWMYGKLHDAIRKRAIQEMIHAEKLIARILFLEDKPNLSKLNDLHIGPDVQKQHAYDHKAEQDAIKGYNETIKLAGDLGDHGTRELLVSILKDEEEHIDWIEAQLDQIQQMGIQTYLAEQTD